MNVADLLELQCTFKGQREVVLPTQIEKRAGIPVAFSNPADHRLDRQRLAHKVGQLFQSLDIGKPLLQTHVTQPPKIECKQGHHNALTGESFGTGHPDFRTSMQVDAAVSLAGDRATDRVADRQRRMPLPLHLAEGRQRVCRLARLR